MDLSPGYVSLFRSGELEQRVLALESRLSRCNLCPRDCGVDRRNGASGYCRSGPEAEIASCCAHHGEEPALSGTAGSGTIFFARCTMRCCFCQNHLISQPSRKMGFAKMGPGELASCMLDLQAKGCHNINLVSPTHFVPQIVRALASAVPQGLRLPLVYNTNGFDSVPVLEQLDGIVDIYLPDLKYASEQNAWEYSRTKLYVQNAMAALKEMFRQVGPLVTGRDGVATRGLIVRHLVLPNGLADTRECLRWIANDLSPSTAVSLMAQYSPQYRAADYPLLSRKISVSEYAEATQALEEFGLDNGWQQQPESSDCYLPDFGLEHPFEHVTGK
ncbi:MAG: radical SAM protein [Chloroflexi bacterium]|nr:radical SAM protein [Chloroflexota bacterium]